jgi:hypothetical protein
MCNTSATTAAMSRNNPLTMERVSLHSVLVDVFPLLFLDLATTAGFGCSTVS